MDNKEKLINIRASLNVQQHADLDWIRAYLLQQGVVSLKNKTAFNDKLIGIIISLFKEIKQK